MKKNLWLRSVAVIATVAVAVSIGVFAGITSSKADTPTNENTASEDVITVKNPMQKSAYVLDNENVADYFKNYTPGYGLNFFGKGEQLPMKNVKIEWEAENAKYCELWLADNARFSNAMRFVTLDNHVEIDGLIPNRNYFWKVKVTDQNDNQTFSKAYNFRTEGNVRSVCLDGVSNVRDIGGAVTKDGKTIKYGILYRSANGDSITEKGKKTVKKLGIKTDLDLRGDVIDKSPFGDNVNIIKISGAYYNGHEAGVNGSEAYQNAFRDELKACANPDNYPMIFHCAIGRDRTGTLSFILQALCGVEKDALIREYELSYLSVGGALDGNKQMVNTITAFYDFVNTYEGETFADKAGSLVKSLGVTDEDIASIRSILLG